MNTQTSIKLSSVNRMRINLFLDIGLFLIFLIIYEEKATGNAIHEWLGLTMGAVLLVHILLHWQWVVVVIRRFFQRLTREVRLNAIVNICIFICFTAILFSGLMISESVMPLFGVRRMEVPFWKWLHHIASDVTLWLIAIHIGLHWRWIVNVVKRQLVAPLSQRISRSGHMATQGSSETEVHV